LDKEPLLATYKELTFNTLKFIIQRIRLQKKTALKIQSSLFHFWKVAFNGSCDTKPD